MGDRKMEKSIETEFDRGVVNPSHPPIIEVVDLDTGNKSLKAGTILSAAGGVYSAAANSATPVAVLVEDVSASNTTVKARALEHGVVVGSRLLNASQEAPDDTLKGKMHSTGIYLTQNIWDESRFE